MQLCLNGLAIPGMTYALQLYNIVTEKFIL